MTEYWIWNNQQRGWCGRFDDEYTNLLHEAGRYSEAIIPMVLAKFNEGQPGDQWPNVVAIPVTNDYLFAAGREILEEFDGKQGIPFSPEQFRGWISPSSFQAEEEA